MPAEEVAQEQAAAADEHERAHQQKPLQNRHRVPPYSTATDRANHEPTRRNVVDHVEVPEELVPTSVAARALGVNLRTMQRWANQGLIKPDWITPGGHMRWNINRLLREVRNLPREET
jgi:hypothetical protein